ncbi:sugar ABC transporter permease [Bacillus sp. V59.32b]|uniref:sugar ABC transporter permease n=1 Tax=Bacillus sp. V59.32b TaxID=1758642 RepID=UPI000E3CE4A3|nr:sugar ABC transporter permease [Bacillus sp. V59.32b]RFU69319.1 sugar ABC transporter permease [Bacillus sp. V59.32b]
MSIKRDRFIRLSLTYLVVLVMSVIIFYPILWIIGSSLNPGQSLSGSSMFPENPTFKHYAYLFDTDKSLYFTWFWNSIKISLSTMGLTIIVVAFTAYAFSRYRFVGRKNGLVAFLILQMIPNFAALIAIYVLATRTGLIDTHLGLILFYVGGQIPINTWLMKGYLDTIPKELDESAKMDGAGHFRIFWQIVMPLAKPIIAVVALFSFTAPFADFIIARMLIRTDEKYTILVGLYEMVAKQFGNEFTKFAAGAVLIAIPIALLFLAFQRYFVSGLTSGGTKG